MHGEEREMMEFVEMVQLFVSTLYHQKGRGGGRKKRIIKSKAEQYLLVYLG